MKKSISPINKKQIKYKIIISFCILILIIIFHYFLSFLYNKKINNMYLEKNCEKFIKLK